MNSRLNGTPALSYALAKSLKERSSGGSGWSRRLRRPESNRFLMAMRPERTGAPRRAHSPKLRNGIAGAMPVCEIVIRPGHDLRRRPCRTR
jgi:hypothetical protein